MATRIASITCAVALLVALPVLAGPTTATLEGEVTNQDGQAVRDATVIATHTGTGFTRTAIADNDGRFRVPALPPGSYKIECTADGLFFAPVINQLRVGQTIVIAIGMAKQKIEVVTVTAQPPLLNISNPEVSTVVTPTQIEELPLINRDFADLANLAPGAKPKQTGLIDPTKNQDIYRPFTIGAGNGRGVNIQIDGGDNNDNAVGTYTMGLALDAVQEFEIVTDQYKAEYGRASHGMVNVITKSGSNDIDGSIFFLYRDDSLREENFSEKLAAEAVAEPVKKAESERQQYGFSIGGPLVENQLFGFFAFEHTQEDAPVAYSPVLTGFARTAGFAGDSFTSGLDRDLYTAKLNWNANSRNTAYLRFSADDNEFANDQGGALVLEQYNGNSFNEASSILGNWTSVWGGRAVNEVTLHITDFDNGIAPNTAASSLDYITIENYAGFSLGRNPNLPQTTSQKKFQIRNDFSIAIGDHDVKFGIEMIDVEFGDGQLGLTDAATVVFDFDSLIDPDDVDATPDDLGIIDAIRFNNPGLQPGTDYSQLGIYAQDTWQVNDRWTVYYGARLDSDDGLFDAMQQGINRTFYEEVAASTTPDRPIFGRTFPEDPQHISPRAGFVYRFDGEDKDVLRGSWGIYYDKFIDNLAFSSRQNLSPVASPSLGSLNCDMGACVAGTDIDGPGPLAPLPADFTYANWQDSGSALRAWYDDLVSILGPLESFTGGVIANPSPDWETPYTRSTSLAWGHRFNSEWAMDITGIHSQGENQQRFFQVFGTPGGPFNTGVVAASSAFGEIYFMTNGKTEYQSLQAQARAQKPKYSLIFNINLSRSEGTQDTGASAEESGTVDIFSGGNRRYTGNPEDNAFCNSATPHGAASFGSGPICVSEADEMGRLSGDQSIWASIAWIYRLPRDFTISGDLSYGSDIAFWANAGYDQNNDGFNSGSEYVGAPGSGRGDDYLAANLRGTKKFRFAKDMAVDVFLEVFNLTDETNTGLFVDQTQFLAAGVANPDFGTQTGNFLATPRTWNAGARMHF